MNSLEALIQKGVSFPNPQSVEIGDDLDVDRIAGKGVVIHAGSKLYGKQTFIAEGARIGFEAPATVQDCYIGPDVALNGGFFQGAVFLGGAACGSGSHVRSGTIMEEQASIAHTVGLKQTILLPFVTLGSLINFCDCLMAGGRSRTDHSEVGSSYIHFNFTANQDKATPSLIGDVPRGVMLNQSPIFLGGQGGLVGPCRIAYGTVVAAGSICRKDQRLENQLVIGGFSRSGKIPFQSGVFNNSRRILTNNFIYIANLLALRQWYLQARSLFVGPHFPQPLLDGLIDTLKKGIEERVRQLGRLSEKMKASPHGSEFQNAFCIHWPEIESLLPGLQEFGGEAEANERFLQIMDQQIKAMDKSYLAVIQSLDNTQAAIGTKWLESIVEAVMGKMRQLLPSLQES